MYEPTYKNNVYPKSPVTGKKAIWGIGRDKTLPECQNNLCSKAFKYVPRTFSAFYASFATVSMT